jgi:hypothetical protein
MKTMYQKDFLIPSLLGLYWDMGYFPDIGGNVYHGLSVIIYLEAAV